MELTGIVLKVFEDEKTGSFIERIVRVKSDVKGQILDVYTYNRIAFRSGFLLENEKVNFSIVLRGIENEGKQETQIVADKLISPQFKLTRNHPFIDVEFVRGEVSSGK